MEPVRWDHHPQLRRPLLVVAFEGWNDAGDAASLAVSYLAQAWGAVPFAELDPEEFFDFTETRPQVKIVDGATRAVEWPVTEFLHAEVPGTGRDVVLVRGVEPQLKWRTFCSAIVEVATSLGVEMAATLGALLADVPHTRPVKVTGTTDDAELAGRLGLSASTYEGPTGIVGVLHDAFDKAGMRTASFWAAVPHYVHQVPSPKAALALVERSASLVGARVNPLELRVAAEEYERQVSERVADDEDAAAYVAQLEEADDDERRDEANAALPVDAGRLADEVERFLREQGDVS
ncbi:PAC2 family protein [Acidiferrimicrobium sp. IK]|uniref:PAC2 family protein n=1 Tax=Acidiferrimicrobium sp. IK TaxID=2871700 RepID=UPI0021CB31C3|nr:PAC2 family protein [Acidiferrimicrobium sp. IK]MCU4186917.1 PAC2 family protein [Acidiferrimicrobium sp. IK]